MRNFLASRRPTPAMAVAFVALLAALSGTAVALPGKNTVDSADIKNKQVKGKDLASNAVTGAKVKNRSLSGSDVKDESLTGADLNESSLGKVPAATSADNAATANSANTAGDAKTANGVAFEKFFFADNAGSAQQTVLDNFGGLTIKAQCAAGGVNQLEATTSVDNVEFWGRSINFADVAIGDADGQFMVGDTYDLDVGLRGDEVSGSLIYVRPDGHVVTVEFLAEQNFSNGPGARDCGYAGIASSK